jgi:5-methylcytosine-specific restriction endonuclease McrA
MIWSGHANEHTSRRSQYQASSSHWITAWKRLAVYMRDGFRCCYCGRDLRDEKPANVHLDHLVSRKDGGSHNNETPDYARNLVTSCGSCNCARGSKQWRDYAPGGAIERIEKQRRMKLNGSLARAILRGEAPDPRKES